MDREETRDPIPQDLVATVRIWAYEMITTTWPIADSKKRKTGDEDDGQDADPDGVDGNDDSAVTAPWYDVAPSPPAIASWLNTDTLSPFWAVLRISKLTQAICTLNPCWDNCSVNIGCFLSPRVFIMCLTPLAPKGHQVAPISRTNTCSAYTSLFYTSFWYQQKFPESNQLPPWISCVRHSWPFAQTEWIIAWVICGVWVQIIWIVLTATDRAPGYQCWHHRTSACLILALDSWKLFQRATNPPRMASIPAE